MGSSSLFDSYGRQARLFPGLLALFPPLLAVLAWFPWLILSNVAASLLTLAVSCGLLYFLASYARTKGKRVEPELLRNWGGWSTTLLLRHEGELDRHTRSRYHTFLGRSVPGGLEIPTMDQEREDPVAADAVYGSAVRWLKERTRGNEFMMVNRENAQYGFRRNLLGLKPLAICLCVAAMFITVVAIGYRYPQAWSAVVAWNVPAISAVLGSVGPAIIGTFLINALAIVIWGSVISQAWVREAAFQYALALLAAIDQIEASGQSSAV